MSHDTNTPSNENTIVVRVARPDELAWANERYAEVNFVPTAARDLLVVGEVDGERAGLGRVVQLAPGVAELGGVLVLEAFRGRGVARAIVDFANERANAYERIYCVPFANLVAFYESYGFKTIEAHEAIDESARAKHALCQTHYAEPTRLLMRSP